MPVSYTYDHVAEGVFLDELMGIPKVRWSCRYVERSRVKQNRCVRFATTLRYLKKGGIQLSVHYNLGQLCIAFFTTGRTNALVFFL